MAPAYIHLAASYFPYDLTSPPQIIFTALRSIKNAATPSYFRQMPDFVLVYLNTLSYGCIYKSIC